MGEELVYKMRVTKDGKTELWRLCLPLGMIDDAVMEQYQWGADAVELEWMPNITREQFHSQLPKG